MADQTVLERMSQFYQKFPYPHYPLFAKPLPEQGYLAAPGFAKRLLGRTLGGSDKIACLGSGEILPCILRRWSAQNRLVCVDISRRSLRRARMRLAFDLNTEFVLSDLTGWLSDQKDESLGHIDAYGVLHHLASPDLALQQIARTLTADGTVRLMIYNQKARSWIWNINRLLRAAGMDHNKVREAYAFTKTLCRDAGGWLLDNWIHSGHDRAFHATRFADTFLNPHELQRPLRWWWQQFESSGLKPYALFDRYTELDDLRNPLWEMPSLAQLEERIADGRFENNFEIYLTKKLPTSIEQKASIPVNFRRRAPPLWFTYRETSELSPYARKHLWMGFVQDHLIEDMEVLSFETLQRLARLGALPSQMRQRKLLLQPMSRSMEAPRRESLKIPSNFPTHLQARFDRLKSTYSSSIS